MDFLAGINTEGIQNLILTFLNGLANLDLKALDFDFLGELLTMVAPIWNPIWAAITEMLGEYIGL